MNISRKCFVCCSLQLYVITKIEWLRFQILKINHNWYINKDYFLNDVYSYCEFHHGRNAQQLLLLGHTNIYLYAGVPLFSQIVGSGHTAQQTHVLVDGVTSPFRRPRSVRVVVKKGIGFLCKRTTIKLETHVSIK